MARDERTAGAQTTYPTQDGVNPSGSVATPIHVIIQQESIAGDMTVGGSLTAAGVDITDHLTVEGSPIQFSDDVTMQAGLAVSGDVTAGGGRTLAIGPFYVTTAASQSAVGTKLGDTVGQTWVAPFDGSVLGVSGMIDTAVTGAGKSIKVRVYKNGALLNAALDLDFTQAGAETSDRATAAKDAYAFVAGDQLKLVYTTDAITNTPKVTAYLMVEC